MPRIDAPTLAEHRAQQREAILGAARRLLAGGGAGLTLAAVAREAGLARTSLYQYFDSLEALLDALVADVLPRWAERVTGAMAAHDRSGDRVLAYARATLALVAEGEHAVMRGLAVHAPPHLSGAAAELHEALQAPLVDALGDLMTADLVRTLVHSGAQMIEDGAAVDQVIAAVERLLGPYCATLG